MLADPQSINPGGGSVSLPRTEVSPTAATYTSSDGALSMRVTQATANGGSKRTSVTLRSTKIATDPLTATNIRVLDTITVTFNVPPSGFTAAELAAQFNGLSTALNASSGAMILKILAGEK